MNTKDKGELAEAAVIKRLKEMEYTVLSPFGENARYDLVYDDGGLHRVQVKYGGYNNGCVKFSTRSSYQTADGHTQEEYTEEQIDVFMVYSERTDEVYEVPVSETGSVEMRLRVEEPKSKYATTDACNWAVDYRL